MVKGSNLKMGKAQEDAISKMMDDADASLNSSTDDYVDRLMTKWDEFQSRLESDILKIHSEMAKDGMAKDGIVSYSDFTRFSGDKKVSDAIAHELQRLHVSVETDRMEELVNQYKDAYNVSAWTIDEATPPEVDIEYAMPPESQIRQFVTGDWSDMFVTRNAREMYFMGNEIKTQVTLAMLQGQSVDELSKSIQEVIGDDDSDYKYRATRIARTELLRAANLGRSNLYDQNSDILEDQTWVTRALNDARLCEDCAERAGLGYDEVAELADEQELDVDPPVHPNCGCEWAPKLKSMKDLLGPELSKGIKDFNPEEDFKPNPQAYEHWANGNLSMSDRGNL
jgi:SPP1 gp7 family putative phage head morphogenesis protein